MELRTSQSKDGKHALRIDTPVQFIRGVGPHLGGVLARKDIHSVKDLYRGTRGLMKITSGPQYCVPQCRRHCQHQGPGLVCRKRHAWTFVS